MNPNPNPSPELLPCPFCGGEAACDDVGSTRALYSVGCNNNACDADCHFTGFEGYASLIAAWNTRTVAAANDEGVASDTVAFVQDWLANADYDPTQFDKGFASAIDARVAAGIEAAAKVAESRWEVWAVAPYNETPQGDRAACADLAAAIRLLSQGGGK